MATSGSVSGAGVAGGVTWSSASAPYEANPTGDPGVTANFNAADGCPRASVGAFRSRMITQWSAAKLASNGLDPDDMSRIVVSNAVIGYHFNTETMGSPRSTKVAGYPVRTAVSAESWNDAVAAGINGDASPTPFQFPMSVATGAKTFDDGDATAGSLDALIQAQLRSNSADGIISLIHYFDGDSGFNEYALVFGGSNPTTPYEPEGVSISFDWTLESGPVLTMGSQKTYRSGSGASAIDATLTVTSTPNIQTAEIQIQAGEEGDSIAVGALPSGITASELAGVITLTGPASAADFQTALRAMTFSSTAAPSDTLRIIRFFLTDVDEGTSGAIDFNVLVHSSTIAPAIVSQGATIELSKIAGFLRSAATRPVDIGLIADSNGVQVTYSGHTQGLTYAWAQACGCWGSAIAPMTNESNGWLAPVGDVQVGDLGGEGDASAPGDANTPAAFQARLWSPDIDGTGPDCWDYLIPGSAGGVVRDSDDTGLTNQLIVRSRHPMWMNGGLIYQCRVYVPDTDPCQFIYPSVMSGYATGASAIVYPPSPIPISLPESGFGTVTWHIPSGVIVGGDGEISGGDGSAIRIAHSFYTGTPGDAEVRGEYGMLFQSLISAHIDRGVRFSRFIVAGGQPTKFVTDELVSREDEAIAEYFRFMADGQRAAARNAGLSPVCLIHILEGVNDSVDNASGSTIYPRGGPAADDPTNHGNTVQGFTNNTQSIINRLRDIWVTTCGFNEGNLYFLLGGTHPMPSDPQKTFAKETMIEAIEDICAANGNVAGIDGWKIRISDQLQDPYGTQADATAYDHASDGADPAHLNERGYLDYDARLVGTLMGAAHAAGIIGSGSASTFFRPMQR